MLVLDIGGSFIKYALTDESGQLLPDTVSQTPSDAEGSYEAFLDVLDGIIREARRQRTVASACICIAGPFDFEAGVSLMRHKFRALYQRSMRPPFERAGMDVTFLHDSTAFLLGEAYDGTLLGKPSPCCAMLGTGLGFAFMRDGRVCVNEERRPAFTLWNMPYRDGIAEDYVSTRAIQERYGEKIPVRQIADLARAGDRNAVAAFQTTGRHLSAILNELIPKLGCDSFALGGQIAKSAELFELELPVEWHVSAHLDDAALRGAIHYASHGRAACEQTPARLFGNGRGQ